MYKLLVGNSLNAVGEVESESVQLGVTSPPYYRMRRYGVDFVWDGDENCEHEWVSDSVRNTLYRAASGKKQMTNEGSFTDSVKITENKTCLKCGAWLGELGWEQSPELYVSHLADIFDAVKPSMKDTGVLWVNLGDTFAGSMKGYAGNGKWMDRTGTKQGTNGGSLNLQPNNLKEYGYKNKDLLLIPFLFAHEMRRRGWWLRAEVPWICPNKMPGPWKDRPIIGHEWFLMFTKSAKCSYNADKVLVESISGETGRNRRTSDFFSDSLGDSIQFYKDYLSYLERINSGEEGLLVDECGDPLALYVNNRPSSLKHYAMYNENLIRPLIEACTDPGDWVLDPFSGTSTTGRIALSLKRNYIGVEAKPEYADMARETLDEIVNLPEQMDMFSTTEL